MKNTPTLPVSLGATKIRSPFCYATAESPGDNLIFSSERHIITVI